MNCIQIKFKKSPVKYIKNMSRKDQIRVLNKINKLPDGEHIKKLERYKNRFRLRVGDFRIIYEIHKTADNVNSHDGNIVITILIMEIGTRGDIYKRNT